MADDSKSSSPSRSQDDLVAKYPNLKRFLPFLQALNKESPRGAVLISCGYLEELLRQVLLAFMIDKPAARDLVEGGNAPLATFSSRINASYLLGLISEDEYHDSNLMRKIRNDFAHNIDITFETPSIIDRCKLLKYKLHDYGEVVVSPVDQYKTGAASIILHFINRAFYVSQKRLKTEMWPY